MPILRTDVQRALNEIIAQENGMRFQGLAVALGKKRWPELVAHPRKKDFGLDAYVAPELASDGIGKGLAASISASWAKVKSDAEEAKRNYTGLSRLLFVTAGTVGNVHRRNWEVRLRDELGLELMIIEREEIIAQMLAPENAALCASHLYLRGDPEPGVSDVLLRAQRAATSTVAAWSRRVAGEPLIALSAQEIGADAELAETPRSLDWIEEALRRSARIVVEAPAGRGKTTTLIQLAQRPRSIGVPLLVDLPAWAMSRASILDYVAGTPAFAAEGLTSAMLARLATQEPLLFLLNGWNEISEAHADAATHALRNLERDFPNAGIIVATRTHHLTPPLPGATRLRLLRLDREQRNAYLDQRLGDRASALRTRLANDRALAELTLTPLILSQVAALADAGADIPSTKLGILATVLDLREAGEDHRNALMSRPIAGQSTIFLTALATAMTRKGAIALPEQEARVTVGERIRALVDDGLTEPVGAPAVLGVLTAHHVLERVEYPVPTYQFEHQQLQEYYAAIAAHHALTTSLGDASAIPAVTRDLVNRPAWGEALNMLAEHGIPRLGAANADAPDVRPHLIELALSVDPIFACHLFRLARDSVPAQLSEDFAARLRALYVDESETWRDVALAGMIATGSPEFRDIVVPRLADADQQIRLSTYRLGSEFYLESLGYQWQRTVASWSEPARRDLVGEVLHARADIEVAAFAALDPSPHVRVAAAEGLIWRGQPELTSSLLASMDDATFDPFATRHFDELPSAQRTRAIDVLRRMAEEDPSSLQRLHAWLLLAGAGDAPPIDWIKASLDRLSVQDADRADLAFVRPALEHLQGADPTWLNHWIIEAITDGRLSRYPEFLELVPEVPADIADELLERLESQERPCMRSAGIANVLSHHASPDRVSRVFHRMRQLRELMGESRANRERYTSAWHALHDLHGLMLSFSHDTLARGLLDAARQGDPDDVLLVSEILSRVARSDADPISLQDDGLRRETRAFLIANVDAVLARDDFSGFEKASFASAVAQVGEPADVDHLLRVIAADTQRIEVGIAARLRGGTGPRVDGAMHRYSMWNVASLKILDPAGATDALIGLLSNPYYQTDVANALAQTYLPRGLSPLYRSFRSELVMQARAQVFEEHANPERNRVAAALGASLQSALGELNSGGAELARALAAVDGYRSAPLVLRGLERGRSVYTKLETLQRLAASGAIIPSLAVLSIIDELVTRHSSWLSDSDRHLLSQALELCVFVDDMPAGLERIRSTLARHRLFGGEIERIILALAHSRNLDAATLLAELASDTERYEHNERAFLSAFSLVDAPAVLEQLASFIDPLTSLPVRVYGDERALAGVLATVAARDAGFRDRLMGLAHRPLSRDRRLLLAQVFARVASDDAVMAALQLLDDHADEPIPFGVFDLLRGKFVEQRASAEWSYYFTEHPRPLNDVREQLFNLASVGGHQERSAATLLGQIELWRLEHGRPLDEPRHPSFGSDAPWPP